MIEKFPFRLTLLACLLATLLLFSCSGDGDEGEVDGDDTGPIKGDQYYDGEGAGAQAPYFFRDGNGDDILLYRNQSGIYHKNMTFDNPPSGIDLLGMASPALGVTQFAVNENYFVWNANTPQTYRHQWLTNTTLDASTGPLAPGFCLVRRASETFTAATPGGYMFNITLSKFTDTSELANRTTLLDPALGSDPISVQAFACSGALAFVATNDGRLFDFNTNDNNPTLNPFAVDDGKLISLLQFSSPYLVWVDVNGDIQMYNTQTDEGPVLAINVDPLERNTIAVDDIRIFGSIVLWSDDSEGDYNIWAADLEAMEDENDYIQVTSHNANQRFPFLFDGMIYWEDDRGDIPEIYTGDMPSL